MMLALSLSSTHMITKRAFWRPFRGFHIKEGTLKQVTLVLLNLCNVFFHASWNMFWIACHAIFPIADRSKVVKCLYLSYVLQPSVRCVTGELWALNFEPLFRRKSYAACEGCSLHPGWRNQEGRSQSASSFDRRPFPRRRQQNLPGDTDWGWVIRVCVSFRLPSSIQLTVYLYIYLQSVF